MRIGVLTTSYPRDDEDPAGNFVAGFARWLAAEVGDVEVLAASAERRLFYRGGAPSALGLGSAPSALGRGGAPSALGRGGASSVLERGGAASVLGGARWLEAAAFSTALAARAATRAKNWDAIVSHWLVPAAAVGVALAGARPHLAIAHGSDVRLVSSLPGGKKFVRALARRADLVYVARALAVDGAPGRVVAMGIDTAQFSGGARARARAALGIDGFAILYMGRLSYEKGPDLAIDALPDGATLLIAGAGPERDALARRCGANVRLLGEVRGAARRDLYAACDALVVPSRHDGAPTVIREAHAAGLPVVATRVGGIPELIEDGVTGLLCDPPSGTRPNSGIRTALVRLADDPALARALVENGLRAARSYDWREVGPLLAKRLVRHDARSGTLEITRL